MKKKVLTLLMVVSMFITVLSITPTVIQAEDMQDYLDEQTEYNPLYYGDELVEHYEDNPLIEESEISLAEEAPTVNAVMYDGNSYALTPWEAGSQMRNNMKKRNTSFTVYYACDSSDWDDVKEAIYITAFMHTGNPFEGDYLQWHWKSRSYSGSRTLFKNIYYYRLTYTYEYYTTFAQELAVDSFLDTTISNFNFQDSNSEYDKVKAFYDYVCANVTYGLPSSSIDHTAYAAAINKSAVCQGYASLMYNYCMKLNIDARVIAGTTKKSSDSSVDLGAHGWNIIRVGNTYYNLDATWGASNYKYGNTGKYFLKGSNNFADHYPYSGYSYSYSNGWKDKYSYTLDYTSDSFLNNYQTSTIDFVNCTSGNHVEEFPAYTNASCTMAGILETRCTNCGIWWHRYNVDALKHTYVVGRKATKSTDGYLYCKNCDYSKAIFSPNTMTLSYSKTAYTGSAKKPTVTIKDRKGNKIDKSYYTVKYTNNTKVGKAKVTVTFKNRYSGTMSKEFTINPKATSITSLTSGSRRFTVKWTKRTVQCNGYQIRYSTSSSFGSNNHTVRITSNSTYKKTITSLKPRKKYYVKVRTYKSVNGTKYYSGWCTKKATTTKA